MIRTALITLLLATPALAEGEFSEGSEARAWGVAGEEPARFTGKVVDIVCELAGDCTPDCGAGARQMGIIRDADDVLVLVAKNSQAAFTGAAVELAPFCNQMVEVDGNLVGDTDYTPTKFYQIQLIRTVGTEEWTKANQWTKAWNANHPEFEGVKGPWFRKDTRIKERVEANGYLGLGLDVDETFKEEWFAE
ncbi:MAG: hypothetical protein AAFY59_05795 [Pseudomonadota bacterium]